MRKSCSMPLIIAGILLSSAALADDQPAAPSDVAQQTELTPAAREFIAELERSSRPQLPYAFQAIHYADVSLRPLADIKFEDSYFLARVSRLRRVSFVTLGEVGDAQLFLGVNDKGLIGIHFNAYRERSSDRQLEMYRMPYLATEAEPAEAE
jgi:hypothetical protein